MVVAEKSRQRGVGRESKGIRRHFADIAGCVPGDEQVFPSVIIVIKEPTGKAEDRVRHTGLAADFGEFPTTRARLGGTVVVEQQITSSISARQVEIRPPIMVVVRAGNCLY